MLAKSAVIVILIFFGFSASSQDSLQKGADHLPSKYLANVSSKAVGLEQKLDKKTDAAIEQMMGLEEKMKKKLTRMDSLKAQQVFGDIKQKYKTLREQLQNKISDRQYIPSLDTLSTSLKFLEQNQQLLTQVKDGEKKLKDALSKVNGLEGQFKKAEEIKKFLKERRELLKQQLEQWGFAKQLKKLNKQVYYYSEQINEYKALLKDHKKAEKKAIELLSKTKLFKDFMRKNSMLASLFRLPGDPNDPATQISLSGLQTRVQVNNLIQQQIGTAGQAQFRQNIRDAQSQVNQLKEKVLRGGGGSSDDIMPSGFKPNDQKIKSFWKRLEYGTNIQTQKATNFFPVTSDIGLSLGYKLNDKSVIGVGASYKLGMGRGWNNIRISHQGAGLRSYVDWKIKGSFWISGGYEMNYKTEFNNIDVLKDINAWQRSGLIGLNKVISMKTKFFKKTKLQLLWDFLSYEQVPRTSPIVFRLGYNF